MKKYRVSYRTKRFLKQCPQCFRKCESHNPAVIFEDTQKSLNREQATPFSADSVAYSTWGIPVGKPQGMAVQTSSEFLRQSEGCVDLMDHSLIDNSRRFLLCCVTVAHCLSVSKISSFTALPTGFHTITLYTESKYFAYDRREEGGRARLTVRCPEHQRSRIAWNFEIV